MRVNLTENQVRQWAHAWPCFGTPCALWFEFDSQGNLVDMSDVTGIDESALLALSHDAQSGKVQP